MTSSLPAFSSRVDDGLDRALHVALDDEREFLAAGTLLKVAHHVGERAAGRAARAPGRSRFWRVPVFRDLAGAGLGIDHRDAVAGFGRAVEAEHLDGNRRARFLDRAAEIVDERAHAAPLGPGDHDVAGVQGAALDEDGRHGTAAAVELRLDDGALRRPVRDSPSARGSRPGAGGLREANRAHRRSWPKPRIRGSRRPWIRPRSRAGAVPCAPAADWRRACRSC